MAKHQTEEGDEFDVYDGEPDDLPRSKNDLQDDLEDDDA